MSWGDAGFAEVGNCGDDASAEVSHPHLIDGNAGSEGVVGLGEPFGKSQTTAAGAFKGWLGFVVLEACVAQDLGCVGFDWFAETRWVATSEEVALRGLGVVVEDSDVRGLFELATEFVEFFLKGSDDGG